MHLWSWLKCRYVTAVILEFLCLWGCWIVRMIMYIMHWCQMTSDPAPPSKKLSTQRTWVVFKFEVDFPDVRVQMARLGEAPSTLSTRNLQADTQVVRGQLREHRNMELIVFYSPAWNMLNIKSRSQNGLNATSIWTICSFKWHKCHSIFAALYFYFF